ncbi:PREDICTED: nocturnin [Condylura cristata]|uniref:nocturnin n=1 Tax=Condylura cristata TaxID=143302 RepID=UPI0006430C08|nr:PREDICTED: nocturnin [Condylura cristata]
MTLHMLSLGKRFIYKADLTALRQNLPARPRHDPVSLVTNARQAANDTPIHYPKGRESRNEGEEAALGRRVAAGVRRTTDQAPTLVPHCPASHGGLRPGLEHRCSCHIQPYSDACSMGSGTSRLYGALTKTLHSSAATQHPEYLAAPDPEHQEPIDPKELLEECRAVLHSRPPRFQRDFVDLSTDCLSSHPPIRVMQWNILAQGTGERLRSLSSDCKPVQKRTLRRQRGYSALEGDRGGVRTGHWVRVWASCGAHPRSHGHQPVEANSHTAADLSADTDQTLSNRVSRARPRALTPRQGER